MYNLSFYYCYYHYNKMTATSALPVRCARGESQLPPRFVVVVHRQCLIKRPCPWCSCECTEDAPCRLSDAGRI